VRCLPSELVGNALFNGRNRNQKRTQLKDAEIAMIGKGRILISEGWEMRQDEETIVRELIHMLMSKKCSIDQAIEFTRYAMCKAIDWSNDSRSYKRLLDCLERMHKTFLKIIYERNGLKANVSFCMIPMLSCYDIDTGQPLQLIQVRISTELAEMFRDKNFNTRSSWSQRLALPVGIATWLHSYYQKHSQPFPIKLETIKKGAGLTMQPKHLRRHITKALEALKRVGFLSSYRIEGDLVHVVRTGSKNLAC